MGGSAKKLAAVLSGLHTRRHIRERHEITSYLRVLSQVRSARFEPPVVAVGVSHPQVHRVRR